MIFTASRNHKQHLHGVSVTFLDRDVESNYKTSLALQGWVVAKHGVPTTLLVTCKGTIVGATKFQYERPDVAARLKLSELPYKPGFHIRLSKLSLPRDLALEVWSDIKMQDGRLHRVHVGDVRGDRGELPHNIVESRYSPIIVPAIGRSGTTLMMSVLNSHPEIIAPGSYPYEYRQASYFWHAMRIMTHPANFEMSMHPDSFETDSFYALGYNPYIHRMYHKAHGFNQVSTWQDEVLPSATINFFKSMVDEYIDRVIADSGRPQIKFVAEKTLVSPMNEIVMNVYSGARQIILVRDLRDSFLSARAFNEKRGTQSFGFDGRTDKQVLASRAHIANLMVQAHRFADDRTIFIRYEDLIHDQRFTLTTIFQFLELKHSPALIDAIAESLANDTRQRSVHSTTKDPVSSVERWRRELSEEDQEFCSKTYQEFFEAFGYPLC